MFEDILCLFGSGTIDKQRSVERVSDLFCGHTNLIIGFLAPENSNDD